MFNRGGERGIVCCSRQRPIPQPWGPVEEEFGPVVLDHISRPLRHQCPQYHYPHGTKDPVLHPGVVIIVWLVLPRVKVDEALLQNTENWALIITIKMKEMIKPPLQTVKNVLTFVQHTLKGSTPYCTEILLSWNNSNTGTYFIMHTILTHLLGLNSLKLNSLSIQDLGRFISLIRETLH